jgi:GNAT superfamily N-acetyltransferase
VSELAVGPAAPDDVRDIQRRRGIDDAGRRLSLEFAEHGGAWVARDQGDVVAIALAHISEEERYLGDLFVEGSYRGQGIGTRLLDAALAEADDRTRTLLLDQRDPAAFAVVLRRRISIREPILRFAGAVPRDDELAAMAAGEYRFGVEAIDPLAHGFGLSALDRQTRGTSRPEDHLSFSRTGSGHAFFRDGEMIGYAYVWPDGRIGPIACASEAYLVQILAYALAALGRRYGATWCSALVPGSNTRIARAALRAGLRIHDSLLVASDGTEFNLSTYVGCHPLLL